MAKTIICVATPLYAPDIGGPATHMALLEQGLLQDEFELRIVKFSGVRHLPKGIKHLIYMFRVMHAGKSAHVIYALDPVSVGFPALLASRLLGKPFILRVGGDYAWEQGVQRFDINETLDTFIEHPHTSSGVRFLQAIQSYVARRARTVVAPSEYLAGIIASWGVPLTNIKVIYSQPEFIELPMKSDARKHLRIHHNEEVVLSAGRLVPWKGFEALIDAVVEVRQHRDTKLYIAGDGPERGTIEAHIKARTAEGFVTLLGHVEHAQLGVWLSAADIFALNTKYEGLSHTILEAFAARTPVVTTPAGGNIELIENNVTGVLVPQDDVHALSTSILHLLEDRVESAHLADRAYMSLERFNADLALEKLESLFQSI